MRKLISLLMALALIALPALAADDVKEVDRLENAGSVMEEILNVPDDIPTDLLNKAECVVVFPSVLKAAFGIGELWPRRNDLPHGPAFHGTMGLSFDDGFGRRELRIPAWRRGDRFRAPDHEPARRHLHLEQ